MAHTAGPWLVDGIGTERGTFEIWSSRADLTSERLLCSNDGLLNEVEPEESIANGYLIAASPELFEAAKEVERFMYLFTIDYDESEPFSLAVEQLRAAITKATEGEIK